MRQAGASGLVPGLSAWS